MKVQDLSLAELKRDWVTYNEMVEVTQCYGVRDLRYLYTLEGELARRGYEVVNNYSIKKAR